jgi:hypothetical protein
MKETLSRNELIEKVENINGMIPPHLSILFHHGVPIKEQPTNVLRLIIDGFSNL